jgi:hypothetical protein
MEGYQWCYSHRPDLAEQRKANARRGGRAGGRGRSSLDETEQAKKYIKGLVSQLLKGQVRREIANSCFTGLNVLARYVELERRIHEQDELEQRIEALERRQRTQQNTFQTRYRS